MATEKITFEQFMETVEEQNTAFIQDLHDYLLASGCKVAFEQKKNGMLASFKLGKPPRAVCNFLFRKHGMLVRIYGENIYKYDDFMQTLPEEMVASIAASGDCGRMVSGTCSTNCKGYDVTIRGERFQKCRYGAFELLIVAESTSFIKAFVEHEIEARVEG